MEDLKKWYRAGLATRIEALKAARRELDGSLEPIESVRRIAHTLRGSGATYGFPEITETAAALEDAGPAEFPHALEKLLETIQEICAVSEMEDKAGILLIDDDPYITDLLRTVLESSNREPQQVALRCMLLQHRWTNLHHITRRLMQIWLSFQRQNSRHWRDNEHTRSSV